MKSIDTLNDVLFEQLDRINKCTLDDDKLVQEITRGDAVIRVAKTIIDNGRLVLDAAVAADKAMGVLDVPLLVSKKQNNEKETERKLLVRKSDG